VDIDFFSASSDERIANTLVFCAKLDYFPNAQAILHFCENILPLIWRERPQARLSIVGNNPPRAVRALAADERITVTGYVPDIRPYLEKADVALAPLLVAAGTQFKVLEALSMGAPMVTTPRCAAALGAEAGVQLLAVKAGEPQAFAGAVIRLLDDPGYAAQLGKAGRQFVVERYSWASSAEILKRLYDAIAPAPARQKAQALLVLERAQGRHALEVEVERRRAHAHAFRERIDRERLRPAAGMRRARSLAARSGEAPLAAAYSSPA